MKLRSHNTTEFRRLRRSTNSAFTLVEVIVAFALGMLIIAGASTFIFFSSKAFSGIAAQNVLSGQAGNTIALIQDRVRLATSVSNDVAGNVLTMGFDDNLNVDSDGNGNTYNDKNHYEQFKFLGVNTTNSVACSNNSLVYIPNTAVAKTNVLIKKGVRNLPGTKIFTITNTVVALIRFGIADAYTQDNYQAIDMQGTAVSLNRPATTNLIGIIP